MNITDTFTRTDAQFFRMVQSLLPAAFVFGASVLLGSYADEEPPYVPAEQVQVETTVSVRV